MEKCPNCGITYKKFRTGLSFVEVQEDMFVASTDSADWIYKRRHSVLGRWHMIKKIMWETHLAECSETIKEKDFTREKFY